MRKTHMFTRLKGICIVVPFILNLFSTYEILLMCLAFSLKILR